MARVSSVLCVTLAAACAAAEPTFAWGELRVIPHDGYPQQIRLGDLDGDGRMEVLLANRRQARIDRIRWLPPGERKDPVLDPNAINHLPLAAECGEEHIPLEFMPHDVLAVDGRLLVVTARPNRVQWLERTDGKNWQVTSSRELLQDELADQPVLHDAPRRRLYIADKNGIQLLDLAGKGPATRLRPVDTSPRFHWWLTELDGRPVMLELVRQGKVSLRTSQLAPEWQPTRPIHQQVVTAACPLASTQGTRIAVVDAQQSQLRLYTPRRGEQESSPFGQRADVVLPASGAPWCVAPIAGAPVLIAVDGSSASLVLHHWNADGWSAAVRFPGLAKVKAIAPCGTNAAVLLWTEGAATVAQSRWEDGRLGYPRPLADSTSGSLLHLAHEAGTTWWVVKNGSELVLTLWPGDADEPTAHRFPGAGDKVERVRWLGRRQLLVQDATSRDARLLNLGDDGAVATQASGHLKKVDMTSYRVLPGADGPRPARLADGVLQWLDAGLLPEDQALIDDGSPLIDYARDGDGDGWGLASGGQAVYRLAVDAGGVQRSGERYELPGGKKLHWLAGLGFLLEDGERVMRLSPGAESRLELASSLDLGEALRTQVREAQADWLWNLDLDGDGNDELMALDYSHHRLSVCTVSDAGLSLVASWPVFEDKTYPYGVPEDEEAETEPRSLASGDFDGDGKRELFLLCHDRLLIYLAAAAETLP